MKLADAPHTIRSQGGPSTLRGRFRIAVTAAAVCCAAAMASA